jgi:hypothetical protein
MNTRQDKVMPLREAIREYVKDGSHISFFFDHSSAIWVENRASKNYLQMAWVI